MSVADIMNLSGSSTTTDLTSAAQNLGKDEFMKLLVTQLQNQDPFEPVDNTAFVAQLAQFSSLEKTEEMNDNMVSLMELQENAVRLSSLSEGAAMIGKVVAYYNPEDDTVLSGTVEAVEAMDGNGTVTLKIGQHLVPLANVMEVTLPDPSAEE